MDPLPSSSTPSRDRHVRTGRVKQWIKEYPTELLLFLLLWGTYAYFYQSTQHNEAARFDQMRALVHDHTLAIDSYWWNSADVIRYPKNGTDHIYPNKAPGGTLLGTVPFAVITLALCPFQWWGGPAWIYWHLVCYLTVLSTVSLISSVAAVAMYRVGRRITGDSYSAMISVIAIWLGTLAFPYSTLFFSHQLAASSLTVGFALVFCWKHSEAVTDRGSRLRFFLAGLLLGVSAISEYPTVLLAALISAYTFWSVVKRDFTAEEKVWLVISFTSGAALTVVALASYNLAAFGKLAYVPIEAYASANSAFPTHARGILGFQWNGWAHFLHALAAVTIRPKIGLLYLGVEHWIVYGCSPVLWLALPGLGLLVWRRQSRAEGVLIVAMITAYLLFITSYGTWEYDWAGGSYFGTRHLVPLLGFLALPLAMIARRWSAVFYPLLAVSVFYMLLGTAIEPRVGYPTANPHRDIFLPEFLRGHFAQNTASLFDGGLHFLTKDSTAFNLGKLARLPARHQLAPLMLWWLFGGGLLVIVTTKPPTGSHEASAELDKVYVPRGRMAGVFAFVLLITLLPIIHHAAYGARHRRSGLFAKYYRNANWSAKPIETQVDPTIDFDWASKLPFPPPFSAEWSGSIVIDRSGAYTFGLVADDGAVVEIDGTVVVDALKVVLQKLSGSVNLSEGKHSIRVRYFNALFGGSVKLTYIRPGQEEKVVPATVLLPYPPAHYPRAK